MDYINPNLDWYLSISKQNSVLPRCPYTSVQRCPRYYQSLSLLGSAGATAIAEKEDKHLLEMWQKSDLWPTVTEQCSSVSGESKPGSRHTFGNYCPEVAYETFGFFASFLAPYADEIDKDIAHTNLGKMHSPATDWRWAWAQVIPMHYTQCPLYSPLHYRASQSDLQSSDKKAPEGVIQAILLTIWHWKPLWKWMTIIAIVIIIGSFLVWKELPDKAKERLFGSPSDSEIDQSDSMAQKADSSSSLATRMAIDVRYDTSQEAVSEWKRFDDLYKDISINPSVFVQNGARKTGKVSGHLYSSWTKIPDKNRYCLYIDGFYTEDVPTANGGIRTLTWAIKGKSVYFTEKEKKEGELKVDLSLLGLGIDVPLNATVKIVNGQIMNRKVEIYSGKIKMSTVELGER